MLAAVQWLLCTIILAIVLANVAGKQWPGAGAACYIF